MVFVTPCDTKHFDSHPKFCKNPNFVFCRHPWMADPWPGYIYVRINSTTTDHWMAERRWNCNRFQCHFPIHNRFSGRPAQMNVNRICQHSTDTESKKNRGDRFSFVQTPLMAIHMLSVQRKYLLSTAQALPILFAWILKFFAFSLLTTFYVNSKTTNLELFLWVEAAAVPCFMT